MLIANANMNVKIKGNMKEQLKCRRFKSKLGFTADKVNKFGVSYTIEWANILSKLTFALITMF